MTANIYHTFHCHPDHYDKSRAAYWFADDVPNMIRWRVASKFHEWSPKTVACGSAPPSWEGFAKYGF